jgi:hypothetical protein
MHIGLDKSGAQHQAVCVIVVAALVLLSLSPSAVAQHEHRAARSQWHGDITRFHEHDWRTWHGGHWNHARHDGRLGWWWIVGDLWYFYPMPVYPYPSPWEPPPAALVSPQPGVVPPVPPTANWYYCEASHDYYPYVHVCPGGWKPVPVTP